MRRVLRDLKLHSKGCGKFLIDMKKKRDLAGKFILAYFIVFIILKEIFTFSLLVNYSVPIIGFLIAAFLRYKLKVKKPE